MRRRPSALLLLALLLSAETASAQIFVLPRRPARSRVRYFDFDWQKIDILAGEELAVATEPPLGTVDSASTATSALPPPALYNRRAAGGIRLYFYRQEDLIAERAAASIEATYRDYVRDFQFVPRDLFPYVLYSSYQEFLQTNLFPVSEGTLGVTSTQDLKLALPYFGDYRLFRDVSRHEMAHQFTIQKVRQAAEDVELPTPLSELPLWLVEGLAEYYAKGGLDEEASMLALDVVLNGDVEQGYGLLGFFEDRPFSGLWTYKLGQARCQFLEEVYGAGAIQRILETAPLLAGDVADRRRVAGFAELLEVIFGDPPERVAARFDAWIKRRSLERYLRSRQTVEDVTAIRGLPEFIDGLRMAAGGQLGLYRTLDFETGQASLVLFDPRAPEDDLVVARDGGPGVESLHPVAGRTFDLTSAALVFVAQDGGRDVLYWHALEHGVEERPPPEAPPLEEGRPDPRWRLAPVRVTPTYAVDLGLGRGRRVDLQPAGILAAFSPAFSPDGGRVAFIGLDEQGQRDLYLVHLLLDEPRVERLTRDEFAERELSWGPGGLVYVTDRSPSGHHNLFALAVDGARAPRPLLLEQRDHASPLALADGRVFFSAYADGRAQVYELAGSRVRQRTDFGTGVFDLSPGEAGGLTVLHHHGGRRAAARLPAGALLDLPYATTSSGAVEEPDLPERRPLGEAEPYLAHRPENWQLDSIFTFAGYAAGSIYGRLLLSAGDRLRNHGLLVDIAAYGSFDLTDGVLLYVDQSRRYTYGLGLFQSLLLRSDETFAGLAFDSAERFFGALGIFRYPFDRFVFAQAELLAGGVGFALTPLAEQALSDAGLLADWETANDRISLRGELKLSLGLDTIRYHRGTGPLSGYSALLEGSVAVQPVDEEVFGTVRLDVERYFQLFGRVNFFIRAGAGSTFGGELQRKFFLSSFDTLRGVPFGDQEYLQGRRYLFSTAELQVPLNPLVAFVLFSDIEGIIGFDFGAVNDTLDDLFARRVADFVLGLNFGLGPLVLRLHFAKPIDVGVALPNGGEWVTNFSLGWLYF